MNYLRQEKGFYRSALMLMLPMVLQNLVTNSMALADTFMVGMLGESELAAVTLANSPFFIVSLMTFGVQSGTSVLAAQYYGRGDRDTLSRILGMGWYASMLLTLLMGLAAVTIPEQIMHILTNNEALIAPGASYCRWVGFAYFFDAISQIYIGIQRSMENTKLGMFVLSGAGLLNIFLNWCLIFGHCGLPRMGVAGAALATTISRITKVIAVAVFMRFDKRMPLHWKLIFRPGKIIAKDFLRYALPVMINETLWSTAQSIYSVIMGHMEGSAQILSAYTISGNVDRVVAVGLFAMGASAAIIIGRDIGRGDRENIYKEAVGLMFMAVCIGVASGVITLIVRATLAEGLLFPLMGLSEGASGIAMYMLLVCALVQPLRAVTMTGVVGVFRGGGDVNTAMLIDILPAYLLAVPVTALCGLVFGFGARVVYVTMLLDELLKVILIFIRLPSRRWINDVTRELPQE